jgi:hypothetical protein
VIFFIFLYIFCIVLVYPNFFLKSAKNQKRSAGCLVNLKNNVYRRGLEKNFIDFTILGLFHIQPTRLVGNLML